jgi:putative transposase
MELRKWLGNFGARTLYIKPGSPWDHGFCENFNVKLRDKCLNGEIFFSPKGARIVVEKWREVHDTLHPHSALGYKPPAPEVCSSVVPPNPIPQPKTAM